MPTKPTEPQPQSSPFPSVMCPAEIVPHEATSAVAAVDCGTNSTRLLILRSDGTPITRKMRITRLGHGVAASGHLDPVAVNRTINVLDDFRTLIDRASATRIRLVATSAARDAANGDDFLAQASRAIGVQAELLSGEEEGFLAFSGATADLFERQGSIVTMDIGGGSTELAMGNGNDLEIISMDLGCVRLTERFLLDDPPMPEQLGAANQAIDEELARADDAIPHLRELEPDAILVGMAGTVSTLSSLQQGLAHYDRRLIHHSVLTAEMVIRWTSTLAAESTELRRRRPGMEEGREDVIVGGALVLQRSMQHLGFETCLVSESDILDGLARSLLQPS